MYAVDIVTTDAACGSFWTAAMSAGLISAFCGYASASTPAYWAPMVESMPCDADECAVIARVPKPTPRTIARQAATRRPRWARSEDRMERRTSGPQLPQCVEN